MNLSFSFFVLYLFSSLTLIAVQFWLFFVVYSPTGSLISHLICRAGNAFAVFAQLCLAVNGKFPFGILTSQIRYIDDMVRVLALMFTLLHCIIYIFVINGGFPKLRRDWRD